MQIVQPLKDFMAPDLDDLQLRIPHLLQELPQAASGDHLGDEVDLILLLADPCADERNNVLVFHLLNQLDLRLNPRLLALRQSVQVNNTPGHFSACVVVDCPVDCLVCTSTKLLCESLKATVGGALHESLVIVVFLTLSI